MRRREYLALVGPSALVMVGLLALPLIRTIQWSFQDVRYGERGTFVGLDNYRQALGDPRFLHALGFTVGLTLVVYVVVLIGGYVLAVLVNRLRWSRPLVLGALLVSYVVPQVIGATMVGWLFNANYGGIVHYVVEGVTGIDVLWLVDPWANRLLLLLAVSWSMVPFAMLVILAALQGVPEEVVEAARIDGAGTLQLHTRVMAPMIRPLLGFVSLIVVMDVLRVFDQLVPLSPQAVQLGNESLMLYIYNMAFQDGGQHLGLGSAVDVLLIIVILVLLLPFLRGAGRDGGAV